MDKAVATARARALRNDCTDAEATLWRYLKHNQLEGVKFRRQQPIEQYIVDFVSFSKKLIVELDGGQHQDQRSYDARRDACLSKNGFTVLRFWDHEIFENMEGVLEAIRTHCLKQLPTPPDPPTPSRGEVLRAHARKGRWS
ncbi:endonuclease domain-containing protein [Geomonas subterranea]|uniref:Endonuclease domain-containing protein n=1 Tax=Geomonas subterranea TaxID=2847989 RepID=A0ABX8LEW5_9BACT|nr:MULTISPECIES: endonuclease domain-containing protein [Geomonas]QXE90253.1 endonuclease domain-containing protein [Geomonas subterranea]QXM07621.1 endonuclease domain-containing protein [Geomonas subterranea]